MTYIEIKAEKCTKCKSCIEVCPTGILEMGSESVKETAVERCISCGHCAAICPADAIVSSETNDRTPFTIKEIPADLPPQQALFHLKRSTRRFKEEALDKNTIESLIQYGEKAPSSHNMRHRHYYVVTDKKKIQEMEDLVVKVYRSLLSIFKPPVLKLMGVFSKPMAEEMAEFVIDFKQMVIKNAAGESHIFRDAPCVVVIAAPKGYDQSRDDCVAAQNYMMLYGQTESIGSCIIGYAQYAHKKLAKYLGIPKDTQIYAVTIFGKPIYTYKKSLLHKAPVITWKN